MSPPVKFDEEARRRYLEALRLGHGRHWSARHVGVSPRTVARYVAADRAFAEECGTAEEEAAEPVEAKLYEQATAGEPWAVKLWLERRLSARWGAPAQRVEVEHGGTVRHEVEAGPGLARVAALEAQLLERRAALEEAGVIDVESEEVWPENADTPA